MLPLLHNYKNSVRRILQIKSFLGMKAKKFPHENHISREFFLSNLS